MAMALHLENPLGAWEAGGTVLNNVCVQQVIGGNISKFNEHLGFIIFKDNISHIQGDIRVLIPENLWTLAR